HPVDEHAGGRLGGEIEDPAVHEVLLPVEAAGGERLAEGWHPVLVLEEDVDLRDLALRAAEGVLCHGRQATARRTAAATRPRNLDKRVWIRGRRVHSRSPARIAAKETQPWRT